MSSTNLVLLALDVDVDELVRLLVMELSIVARDDRLLSVFLLAEVVVRMMYDLTDIPVLPGYVIFVNLKLQ